MCRRPCSRNPGLEHGNRMIHDGLPSSVGLGCEDSHIPTLLASTVSQVRVRV